MKVDNFVSNRLKNYIWYISVTTRPPQVCIPGYTPVGARGTIRYIAPEVFCRNFGGVSHKSDVYSYETMVLEMVVVKNIDVSGDCTSEVYFSTLDLQAP